MSALCKRIIVSADKYNVVLNTNHTNDDVLADVNFRRILGCINQLKVLSVAVVETFDNLTCLVNDINERALAANKRIESIALNLTDVDHKVKTTSIYNDANKIAKDHQVNRIPYNISLLIRNTNCNQIAQLHYNCTGTTIISTTITTTSSSSVNLNTNNTSSAPPKLWLLDNIIGENSDCVSNYSDINFFFSSWLDSELQRQDNNKAKKRIDKKKAKLLLTRHGQDEDVEHDEIAYWGENGDIDESVASSANDDYDDDNNDYNDDDQNRASSNKIDNKKFFKTANNVLKAVNLFKSGRSEGKREDKVDTTTSNDDDLLIAKDSPDDKVKKISYSNVFENINSMNSRDSITAKKLDYKEEEDIKEKIREIKKYVDIDPQELPTFNVPGTAINKPKKKKAAKPKADKLNKKIAKLSVNETPPVVRRRSSIEDLVKSRTPISIPSDSPPFSPPSFVSDEPPSPPSDYPISPIKSMLPPPPPPAVRQSMSKLFASSPPPPPPPPGPSKVAISSLLADIKNNQTLRRVSIKEKVDSRAQLLNSIKQRSKDVQERNVDSNKFDNLKSISAIKPTQNEAISAILANRKLIAGSDSDSDSNSDSDFDD